MFYAFYGISLNLLIHNKTSVVCASMNNEHVNRINNVTKYSVRFKTMKTQEKKTLFCMLLIINQSVCTKTFFNFQSVNLFEGNVIFIATLDSVFGCIIACHQHTVSCVATSYNRSSKECQLLAKEPNVPTTQFVADTGRKLHQMV